jgi:Na+/proline symporter/nitrogen-specific signal transduction histidine kinase
MLKKEAILIFSLGYMLLLFAIAYYGDKRAESRRSIISNAYIYALSLAVYCTAWTFYGSVGGATSNGIHFLAVYIGPTLTAALGWIVLRKIIRISKLNRITSIADFIASRYGKSATLAGVVTIIAVLGIIPYISVQIKAVSTTYLLINQYPEISIPNRYADIPVFTDTAFYVALILTVFAILFGTRHLEATERHEGLVAAIAFESIVKLVAFTAVGLFVTYGLYNGFGDLYARAQVDPDVSNLLVIDLSGRNSAGWYTNIFLSMLAIMFLPRQFQVTVVENVNEKHLKKAMWLFPLYLLIINLFVFPVAVGGMLHFNQGGVDPESFVLTLPMAERREVLVLLVFLGGLSAATSMVIIETLALSTMICNDLVMPVLLRLPFLKISQRSNLSTLLLLIRRASIVLVLMLGYAYFYLVSRHFTLISIGLISFTAVAQFGPAILGGIFWKGGNRKGALWGLLAGFLIWAYTLALPSLSQAGFWPESFLTEGPFGIALLKPHQLFHLDAAALGFNQYAHALFWSMLFNLGLYIGISIFTDQTAIEHTQANLFVDVFRYSAEIQRSQFWRGTASIPSLQLLMSRFLGKRRVEEEFSNYAQRHNIDWKKMPTADAQLVSYAERVLAGAIGSASARVMVASVVKEEPLSLEDVMDILKETRRAITHSRELEKAGAKLQAANERLKELDELKNEFISTVTHELRTPLTSIRALAEVLHYTPGIEPAQLKDFSGIIVKESERLSRLINDVLDFQKIQSGRIEWAIVEFNLVKAIEESISATRQLIDDHKIQLETRLTDVPSITGDRDRIIQVLVNLISNAVKFCPHEQGKIQIGLKMKTKCLMVNVRDNGIGIHTDEQKNIFKAFRQVKEHTKGRPKGTGLGLSISKRIIDYHGGDIRVVSEAGKGSNFIFTLPI